MEDNPQGIAIQTYDETGRPMNLVQKADGAIVMSTEEYNKYLAQKKVQQKDGDIAISKAPIIEGGRIAGETVGVAKTETTVVQETGNAVKYDTQANDVFAAQNYKLTLVKNDVLSNSKTIIQGKDLWDPKAREILTSDGSKIEDWAKMESESSYATSYGEGKIHYYKNVSTGEISSFDCKMKIPKPKQFRQFDGDDFWVVDLDSTFKPLGVR